MKKNLYTIICALLTLGSSMLLGAVFGTSAHAGKASAAHAGREAQEVCKTVANMHEQ